MRVKQKMSITPTARSGNKSCRRIVLDLATPISSLKGVGPRREQVLNDHGIYTVSDVLYYFPRRHLDRTTITPISIKVHFKPPNSISKTQTTLNIKSGNQEELSVKGRHDPCVGIRAVPIGEAMISCVLLDHLLMHRAQCG